MERTCLGLFKIAALFCAWLLSASDAEAHLVTTGMGPFYDGIGHLLLTPEDIIPAMAVGLYAGLRGKQLGRCAMFIFPVAWLLGGILALRIGGALELHMHLVSFLLLGALIAADLRLHNNMVFLILSTVGVMHGYYNGLAMASGPGALGMFGIAVTLFVLITITSAFVSALHAGWTRVAVRVAGSWITAVGLLMLGWLVKGT